MRHLSRIVWSEGMHLGPHHFQAQAAYFDNVLHFTTSALWFSPFGLSGYELGHEALRNGTVSLNHARGIFSDGLTFHMPECDPLPEPRNIAEMFPPTNNSLGLNLAVPRRKPGGANCSPATDGLSDKFRFGIQEQYVSDDNTGQDEKPIKLGRKNIRLHLDIEPADGLEILPLARVLRDGSGGFIYDDRFIPPCLDIGASERLMSLLQRLVSILQEKSGVLNVIARGSGGHQLGLSAEQVATYWFLHAINHALPGLRHLCSVRHGHPELLFSEMLRLGGALCTFGLDSHPRTLPLYDHLKLEECFEQLDAHILAHLEMIIPSNCIRIALAPISNYFHEGDVTDQRCLGRSRWIFAIRSRMGESELIRQTPQLVKICSNQFVAELMRRALPGLAMTHLPTPPPAVSPKVEWQYFSIDRSGPCWEHLLKTKRVGVYVPGEIPAPELELLVILDS
ncbi:MAG: type VI secretion system baseplate subunit TssK [Acidobacteriia bacterium]|nr:type VI secretion system baseplate subunit TssK [Terriglobia bacterium]